MKKSLLLFISLIILGLVAYTVAKKAEMGKGSVAEESKEISHDETSDSNAQVANPASVFCEENGGTLEMITGTDGSQFGLCHIQDYACEEWTFYRGECDVEGDALKVRQELIAKGLDLDKSKVVIKKHLGKYIEGSVAPIDSLGGGGYFFAVKEGDNVKVLADGNGVILCSSFADYPNFSSYLVPECYDEVTRQSVIR